MFLRRLAHYDRNPPHLAASLLAGRRGHAECIPAWYQELSTVARPAHEGSDGGCDTIEEMVDLTEKRAEVVECYDNEPVDCVMMRIVKQEPGSDAAAAAAAAVGVGVGADSERPGSAAAALVEATVSAALRVKKERV